MVQHTSNLVESGTRKYIRMMLVRSHAFRQRHYNIMFNLTLGVVFVILAIGILYYKRATKEKADERRLRELHSRKYVIDKLSKYNHATLRVDGAYNTPVSSNHPELGQSNLFSDTAMLASAMHESTSHDNNNAGADAGADADADAGRYHNQMLREERNEELKRALGGGMVHRRYRAHYVPNVPMKGHGVSSWMRSMIHEKEKLGDYEIPKYTGAVGALEASLVV